MRDPKNNLFIKLSKVQSLKSPFLVIAVGALALFLLFGIHATILKHPDSESYSSFARDLSSGEIFSRVPAPWYSVVRTPGFPALLAVFQTLFGENPVALFLLHSVLALLVLAAAIFRFKNFVSQWVILLLTLLAFWLWRDYYAVILTEWSALCVLLLFLCFTPQNYKECSPLRLFSIGLILSLLVLIKPALITCLAVVALFVCFAVRREDRRRISVGILLGLLPLFFWCTFNSYRLGSFGVASFKGHNAFGVASLIGSAKFDISDGPDIMRFSNYVNLLKFPQEGQEATVVVDQLPDIYFALPTRFNFNVYQVALQFEKERNYPRQAYDDLMCRYSKRVILENPLSYFKFVLSGLNTLLRDAWFLVISILLLVLLINSGHPLSLFLGAALGLHLSHVLLCSLIQIVNSRYYLLTFIPLGFATVLAMLAVVRVRR